MKNQTLTPEQIKSMSLEQIKSMSLEQIQNYLSNFNNLESLGYTTSDTISCIGTVLITLAPATGKLTMTKSCPVNTPVGTSVTVGAVLKNTGTSNNNSFVILCTISRSDNGAVIESGNSGNLDIKAGATSPQFTKTFTMPSSNVNVVFASQVDQAFNY